MTAETADQVEEDRVAIFPTMNHSLLRTQQHENEHRNLVVLVGKYALNEDSNVLAINLVLVLNVI